MIYRIDELTENQINPITNSAYDSSWLILSLSNSTNYAMLSGVNNGCAYSIMISKVLHKTYISVAEKGTRAGAVTAEILNGATAIPEKPHEVYLDRPFMYMIIDCENKVPFFIGTVTEVEG